jgi:hypothetical protein
VDIASFHRNLRIDRNGSRENEKAARSIMTGGLLETKAMPKHRLLTGFWPTIPASLRRRSAQAGSTVPKLATLREEENR